MHECPDCMQACDCDGEDTWHDWPSSDVLNCTHECEEFEDDDSFDSFEGDDEDIAETQKINSLKGDM